MLSREENETLTRTGPGTLGGELIRRYWFECVFLERISSPFGIAPVW
jgi:phthalate 4,5-dioxygenase oxygenase subunit